GITGAAVATSVSLAIYNLTSVFVIYWRHQITPFTIKNLVGLLIISVILASIQFFPIFLSPLWQAIFNAGLVTLMYLPVVFSLRLSSDLNELLYSTVHRLKQIFMGK
ncbi:MAG: hypothetical protein AAF804_22020, partial [Bacteroidota bacterium]